MKNGRTTSLVVGIVLLLIAINAGLEWFTSITSNPDSHPSTWSIVAVDPTTGDVGAAGASCVAVNPTVLAAFVPGKGIAAVQAELSLENRDRTFHLLQEGFSPEEIIEQMAGDGSDPKKAFRQYGIVTMNDGLVQVAGFTGDGNFNWAGDRQDANYAVSVQGNTLESEYVVERALEAFRARDFVSVSLSDRLMRALEAGSAAGGDKRCNTDGYQQTALSAFIAVSQGDQSPFTAPLTDSIELVSPNIPWLYAAVIEYPGGPNPLITLRHQYDDWRESNLPPCPECDLFPIDVSAGMILQDEAESQPGSQQVTPGMEEKVSEPTSISEETTSSNVDEEILTESNDSFPMWILIPASLGVIGLGVAAVTILRRSKRDPG